MGAVLPCHVGQKRAMRLKLLWPSTTTALNCRRTAALWKRNRDGIGPQLTESSGSARSRAADCSIDGSIAKPPPAAGLCLTRISQRSASHFRTRGMPRGQPNCTVRISSPIAFRSSDGNAFSHFCWARTRHSGANGRLHCVGSDRKPETPPGRYQAAVQPQLLRSEAATTTGMAASAATDRGTVRGTSQLRCSRRPRIWGKR